MTTVLPKHVEGAVRAHGAEGYPEEVCGFLVGTADGQGRRIVRAAERTENRSKSPRGRHYLIHPRDLIALEERLEASKESLLGFYHSHPDHPAQPSSFDRDNAWPWYAYVILSVRGGTPEAMTGWRLRDDRTRFEPEPLEIV